ncbi:MAG: hypothetical protein R3296_02545 [Oleiphilaceae bacterium]|nr:hypothetical protein [Oleiphilaceae bacterium]
MTISEHLESSGYPRAYARAFADAFASTSGLVVANLMKEGFDVPFVLKVVGFNPDDFCVGL